MPMHDDASRSVPLYYNDILPEGNAQRQPLVLCLDTSSSMADEPITMLNRALQDWVRELRADINLTNSVEVALVTFGGRRVCTWKGTTMLADTADPDAFVAAHAFGAPHLQASGVTLMTDALRTAVHLVAARKAALRAAGHLYYRPQICLITDGQPTDTEGRLSDDWRQIVPMLTDQQEKKKFRLFAIGVGGISPHGEQVLRAIAPRYYARLQGFPFRQVLQMLSASAGTQDKGDGEEVYQKIFARFTTQRSAWNT
ncbi:VWA domain-containing protein [Streptomyces sp. SLBN-31]|uniref:vWA domain-containing protein n=1 Tax=unclassified Streptomyces TaxID=2593676 RepID=UPI0021B39FD7|nr:VWA domain-containing protein [Streptomyces sp. SLBN-31]